jgi:hypothetical protein
LSKAALEASLHNLDIWLIAFGILVAIGAVGGSVAGFLHWRRSGELQVIQAAENLSLQGQVAFAQKSASDAGANAAAANERASRVEQAASWRTIPPELSAVLASTFSGGPGGTVTISYPAGDPECLFLASQISRAFQQANDKIGKHLWTIEPQPRLYSHAIYWGIRIFGQATESAEFLRNSFLAAHVPYLTEPVPNILNDSPGIMMGGGPPSAIEIWVGPKLPPN